MKTRAIVQVVIEVETGASWNEGSSIVQVFKQASDHAIGVIDKILRAHVGVRTVGTPKVTAVTTESTE